MTSRLLPCSILLVLVACLQDKAADLEDEETAVTWSDQDGDTIIDLQEGYSLSEELGDDGEPLPLEVDSDGDGTADHLDLDSDDDGILDEIEAGDADPATLPWDSDSDGVADFRDLDSDDNCIADSDELSGDLDGDEIGNFADLDDDGDGILDVWEIDELCVELDSDGDGKPDFQDEDSDGDGVLDLYEGGTTAWSDGPADTDEDGIPDYLDDDSDNDGFTDSQEAGAGDEPRDTDGDGIYDFADTDSDGDGLSDADEADIYGTDPYDDDTDGDGFSDGAELAAGTDPDDAGSVIEGLYVTVDERSDVEHVFEFELSVQMGDVGFLIDTTGSMSGTMNAMASEFGTIITQLSAELPDAEYGAATYDDYAFGGYGDSGSGDRPFILRHQISSNTSLVQTALSTMPLHYGVDGPESGMEALYQGLTGEGYDQNCNGSFDNSTDVRPFLASGADPFGGTGGEASSSGSSGGGQIGGYGFRDYALPILIYATDYDLRDPEAGYGTPGGCFQDAGHSDVVAAATDLGAYLIGIQTNNYTTTPRAQMRSLAEDTSSYADTDGDGAQDDVLVFQWTGSSASLRNTIVDAITALVGSVRFSEISLEVDNDPYGFVVGVDPESYSISDTASGQTVDFTLDFLGAVAATEEDQVFNLTLNVIGDGTVLLDTMDIFVLVPGSSY